MRKKPLYGCAWFKDYLCPYNEPPFEGDVAPCDLCLAAMSIGGLEVMANPPILRRGGPEHRYLPGDPANR